MTCGPKVIFLTCIIEFLHSLLIKICNIYIELKKFSNGLGKCMHIRCYVTGLIKGVEVIDPIFYVSVILINVLLTCIGKFKIINQLHERFSKAVDFFRLFKIWQQLHYVNLVKKQELLRSS